MNNKTLSYSSNIKIYAGDQPQQLFRYNNMYIKNHHNKKGKLFYLTLYGKEESDKKLEIGKNYFCISYQHYKIKCKEKKL